MIRKTLFALAASLMAVSAFGSTIAVMDAGGPSSARIA